MALLTALPRRKEGWLEAMLLPALVLLLTYWLVPKDPLLLQQPFPWLILLPLLIALRYEFLPGALSALILGSALLWHPYPVDSFLSVAAGTLLMTLIAAEYASYWRRRESGRALQEEITNTRLRQLADDLYVTRISLDRLEQSLLYQPISVRSALHELREELNQREGHFDAALVHKLLYFFNQLAGVQVASWLHFAHGQSRPHQLAGLGQATEWDGADPVAKRALQEGRSQQLADLELERIHHYLSVHLHDNGNGGRELLCIEDMSFFAIHAEGIKTIEVFFQYLCNYRDARLASQELLSIWSDCPVDFATDLRQLQTLARIVPQVGTCLRYVFRAGAAAEEITSRIVQLRRGLDVFWVHQQEEQVLLLALLPFAGSNAALGQRGRIEQEMKKCCARFWDEAFLAADFFMVNEQRVTAQVHQWLSLS